MSLEKVSLRNSLPEFRKGTFFTCGAGLEIVGLSFLTT